MLRMVTTALVVSVAMMQAASAAKLPESGMVQKGALTYGVAATFAPFEFQKDGKLTGFDIDFINAIAKKLDAEPKAMNMEFKGLIPALQGKRLDIINSAMYINDKRSEQVDFVPYMKIGNRVVVLKGNPSKIIGRDESICGKTLAVTLGGIEETQARVDNKKCQADGKKPINVLTLPTAQDSVLTLRQGRADALYNSTPGVAKLFAEVPDTFETAGKEFEANTSIGIATRKGDTALQTSLKKAIQEVVADGNYARLLKKYDLPASVSIFK